MTNIITIIDNEIMELSPWQNYGTNGYEYNFYRSLIKDNSEFFTNEIGFTVYESHVFIKNPNLAHWVIDSENIKLLKVAELFQKMYGNCIKYYELEVAKNNLDQLLLKYDSLKAFL